MGDIIFEPRAYCKMLMHCAKYPHCAVNGVLLAKNNHGNDITFVDAVPLFHVCLNVTPMYEVAMPQIDRMASEEGLVIAGYYIAEENLNDIATESALRVASKIAEYFPSACLVAIDNQKFPSVFFGHNGSDGNELPLQVHQAAEGRGFKRRDKSSIFISEETVEKANTLLCGKLKDVVDFDNHLDDLKQDWRNPNINHLIDC